MTDEEIKERKLFNDHCYDEFDKCIVTGGFEECYEELQTCLQPLQDF